MVNSHRISIPTLLEVGQDTLKSIGVVLKKKKFQNIVIFFSDGIYDLVGNQVKDSLKSSQIDILSEKIISTINIEQVVSDAFQISKDADAVVGIGGGRAIDASKYMAYLIKVPFISIPTSTSNDGFSSSSASLIINNTRRTVHAKMPYGIIIDTTIIKGAPDQFLYSGIGDLVSNITAITDWKYEEKHKQTTVNDFSAMIASKSVYSLISYPFKSLKDDQFLQDLVDSLTLNGIAMEIAGSSAPCSGSEHLISHALDQHVKLNELHGIQVGIASYIISNIQSECEMNNDHQIIKQFLTATGFFKYVSILNIKKETYLQAIKFAPSIKPNRYTYIHNKKYQECMFDFVKNDSLLNEVLD